MCDLKEPTNDQHVRRQHLALFRLLMTGAGAVHGDQQQQSPDVPTARHSSMMVCSTSVEWCQQLAASRAHFHRLRLQDHRPARRAVCNVTCLGEPHMPSLADHLL